jgi:hypothetical protein
MTRSLKIQPASLFSLIIGYFSSSIILFLLFWIKFWLAIPLVVVFCYALFLTFRLFFNYFKVIEIPILPTLFLLGISLSSLLLVGFGGLFEQKYDLFYRSSLLFSKLVFTEWPIVDTQHSDLYLSYYLGYFLTPAYLTKVIGDQYFLLIELVINTFLLWSLFILYYARFRNFYFLIVLLPSGIYWFLERYILETNSGFRYFNFLNVIAHGPQQFFPSLLGVLCWYWFDKDLINRTIVFLLCILFFWSPFAVCGLCFIYLIDLTRFNFNLSNSFGIILGLLFLIFFLGKEAPLFFRFIQFSSEGLNYLLFIFIDIILLILLFKPKFDFQFSIVVLFLLLLPLMHFGKHNDLLSKASVPCLLFFYFHILGTSSIQFNKFWVIIIILAFSITSINQLLNIGKPYQSNQFVLSTLKGKNLTEFYDQEVQNQFYSKKSNFFGTYFLKE